MSRVGNAPVTIIEGVEFSIEGNLMKVKGSKGELQQEFNTDLIEIKKEGSQLVFTRKNDTKQAKALHGLYRSLAFNMIVGVNEGFKKSLEIRGVGYRGNVAGKKLTLSLGYSHPIEYTVPEDVTVEFDKDSNNVIHITGVDKARVGQVAANIREYRKPEPYKGKGIRYVDEYVAMKAGKSAAS